MSYALFTLSLRRPFDVYVFHVTSLVSAFFRFVRGVRLIIGLLTAAKYSPVIGYEHYSDVLAGDDAKIRVIA
jgi:hypothetical protein